MLRTATVGNVVADLLQ